MAALGEDIAPFESFTKHTKNVNWVARYWNGKCQRTLTGEVIRHLTRETFVNFVSFVCFVFPQWFHVTPRAAIRCCCQTATSSREILSA